MKILVAYASRHGATQGIAERIATGLRGAGFDVDASPAGSVKRLAGYDAIVIGGAAYMFHWLKDATELVRRNREFLAGKPVWLFSSGPLGTEALDAKGRDQKVASVPQEFPDLLEAVSARGSRIFFGAYDRDQKPIGLAERVMKFMPAGREAIPSGDFRDWPEIDAWAAEIATALQPVATR